MSRRKIKPKAFKVLSCGYCPNWDNESNPNYRDKVGLCTGLKNDVKSSWVDDIPGWCPLPDFEEEK